MNIVKLAAALRAAAEALEEGETAAGTRSLAQRHLPEVDVEVTAKQAAEYLGVAASTIRAWGAQGRLKITKYGRRATRVSMSELRRFKAAHTKVPE